MSSNIEKRGERSSNTENLYLSQFAQRWVDEYGKKKLAPKTLQS